MTKLDEFQFLHLSVLREYVDMEFKEIAPTLPFGYNLERVLDDWSASGILDTMPMISPF
jgi:5'-3' exonuclease